MAKLPPPVKFYRSVGLQVVIEQSKNGINKAGIVGGSEANSFVLQKQGDRNSRVMPPLRPIGGANNNVQGMNRSRPQSDILTVKRLSVNAR